MIPRLILYNFIGLAQESPQRHILGLCRRGSPGVCIANNPAAAFSRGRPAEVCLPWEIARAAFITGHGFGSHHLEPCHGVFTEIYQKSGGMSLMTLAFIHTHTFYILRLLYLNVRPTYR